MSSSFPLSARPRPVWVPADQNLRRLGILLAVLPAVLLVIVLVRSSINVPAPDDYWSTLPFLCDWQAHHSLAERWDLLTGQFVGHRIIFTKLALLVDYGLLGHCNLVGLQMLGIAGWLVTAVTLIVSFPALRNAPWLALPVTLLLMHPQGFSNLIFAIGLGNLWVVAFAFLALWSASSTSWVSFILSLLFSGLSILCFANGLMIFPAVVLSLAIRRDFRRAAVAAFVGGLAFAWYLHNYQSAMGPFSGQELFRKAAIMTGGFASLGNLPVPVSLVAGSLVLLVALGLLCLPKLWRALPLHAGFLVFCGLTVLMAARGRAGWDDSYMLQDRYRLYGLLIVAVIYLAVLALSGPLRRIIGLSAIGLAAVYCFLSYATHVAPMESTKRWFEATALNAQIGVGFPHAIPAGWPAAIASLDRASAAGVYQLPTLLSSSDLATIKALPPVAPAVGPLLQLQPDGSICGYYLLPAAGTTVPDFAVLVGPAQRVILPVALFRSRLSELWPLRSFISPRFGLVVPQAVYVPGPHVLYGLRRDARGQLAVIFASSPTFP
jgi:hypothetical protein